MSTDTETPEDDSWEAQKARAKAFLATIGTKGGHSTSERKRASSAINAAKATKVRLAKKAPPIDSEGQQ